jgi:hypothetical protein
MASTTDRPVRVKMWSEKSPVIERAGSADLAFLAMDTGNVPQQFGVILLLERSGALGLPELRQVVSQRIRAIPRLRQRLITVPVGCGRPVWVDDLDFRIERHVWAVLVHCLETSRPYTISLSP